MSGRPIVPTNIAVELARLTNRVEALERRRPVAGFWEIKVFADDEPVTAGDGAFIYEIPYDLHRAKLRYVNAFLTTPGTGLTTIQIQNVGTVPDPLTYDMLTIPITIDSGEKSAERAATRWEIDKTFDDVYPWPDSNNTLFFTQQLSIDIDTAAGGSMGLGMMLGVE